MRNENYQLPGTPEGRRELLAYLFQTYPQMERTFLTVQHRDFTALSDRDVESFLKQLQDLGAYSPRELERGEDVFNGNRRAGAFPEKPSQKEAPWAQEQQPETD